MENIRNRIDVKLVHNKKCYLILMYKTKLYVEQNI